MMSQAVTRFDLSAANLLFEDPTHTAGAMRALLPAEWPQFPLRNRLHFHNKEEAMLGTSTLVTFTFFVALVIFLLDRLRFLIPFRNHLLHTYGNEIAIFAVLLFVNLFALIFQVS